MKQSPELDAVQERMRPGELTLTGFLGEDTRKLVDILQADEEAVHSRGVSHTQIAGRLKELTEAGRDIMEREVLVEDRFAVRVRDDRGLIPSPWGDGLFQKGDVEMTDRRGGRHFRWNELTLHMVRAHGFYSGRGSSYRLDPADLVDTLGLAPDEEPSEETDLAALDMG